MFVALIERFTHLFRPWSMYVAIVLLLASVWWLTAVDRAPPGADTDQRASGARSEAPSQPAEVAAPDEGQRQIAAFKIPAGLKIQLWAGDSMVANPVALTVDERGRVYVAETNRISHGVEDDREHMDWLDDDLASTTVADRLAMYHKHLKGDLTNYTKEHDRLCLLEDRAGKGEADRVTVFAAGFNAAEDGIGAGVLARHGDVYYTCIPHLWRLRDTKGTGTADVRESLHSGYGVRVSFLGHDLHGLCFGPDGKLYYSIGDRGFHIVTADGRMIANPNTGGVFRCNPDGSDLELFAFGLRNPQKLAFDEYGNLFTCDNNSDSGDRARWVYVVEGSDNGWRMPYQYLPDRGPFNREHLWDPAFPGQAAYIVPPVAWLADGPSGLVYYPGVGWDERWRGHFFLCDFRGTAGPSGIRSVTVKPKGASFEMGDGAECIWHLLATDLAWGPDGGLYITDWITGWSGTGKGHIYKVFDPAKRQDPAVLEVKRLIAEGMTKRPLAELVKLLGHADMRIRQEAQFALAEMGSDVITPLASVAKAHENPLARLHAVWALGQVGYRDARALAPLLALSADADLEVRAQIARVLGDAKYPAGYDRLIELLKDDSPRVRHLAAIALGKLGHPEAISAVLELLRDNDDQDAVVRHSAVMALSGGHEPHSLLTATKDESPAVRMGVLLALRRLESPEIARFLHDPDPRLVVEAARAIHDVPIEAAMPSLARLIERPATGDPLLRDALLRRVLNANYRLGTVEQAAAVARFASLTESPEALRIEALQMLSTWATPSGRDRVTNFWRPLEPRPENLAPDALRPILANIFAGDDKIRQVAAEVAGQLGIREVAPALAALASDTKQPVALRLQAIRALDRMHDERVNEAMSMALTDAEPAIRDEGRRLLASLRPADAIGPLTEALDKGATVERQGALATLAEMKTALADATLSFWLDKLLAGDAPPALQLDLLTAAATRNTPELKAKLARFEAARPKRDSIDPYREALVGGDAERGRKIFFERTQVGCVRCHAVAGVGGEVGPNLSKIGGEKTREYLLEAIVDPNKTIAKGFESVALALDDGRQLAGVLKSENDQELKVMTPEGKLVAVAKTSIEQRTTSASAMPQDIAKPLSKSELRDLVEYLSSLKLSPLTP